MTFTDYKTTKITKPIEQGGIIRFFVVTYDEDGNPVTEYHASTATIFFDSQEDADKATIYAAFEGAPTEAEVEIIEPVDQKSEHKRH